MWSFYKNFLPLVFCVSGVLFAQNNAPLVTSVMEKTAKKYNLLSAFAFDFTLNIDEGGKRIDSFSGVLLVKKDNYYLTFDEQIMANDGTIMWNYQKDTNEASIFDAEDDEFSIFHPLKLLNNWEKEYNAKFMREEELNNQKMNIIDLTPKKKSPFYKIRLFIDQKSSYIQQIIMYDMGGTTLTYLVTKFTPNLAVADTKFSFNKKDYPNVQVIDMR